MKYVLIHVLRISAVVQRHGESVGEYAASTAVKYYTTPLALAIPYVALCNL